MAKRKYPWIFYLGLMLAGCEDPSYQGSCNDDDDLLPSISYFDGAICVDGQAACPDGRDFCDSLQEVAGEFRLLRSCKGPCITCPDHHGACLFRNMETGQYSFLCMEKVSDCWSNSRFLELDSYKKACPRMDPSCF